MNQNIYYILFFLCGILFYYIVNSIDKLDVGDDPLIIGGWCQCAYDNKPVWDQTNVNTIIAGGFQGIGSIGPFGKEIHISNNLSLDDTCYGKNILKKYKHKWLSVGGDAVGCKGEYIIDGNGEYIIDARGNRIKKVSCPEYHKSCLDNALELINKYNFNGIAFDMEGCLSLTLDVMNDINNWITNNKHTLGKDFKYVYVGGEYQSGYNFNNFSYICPMLYTNDESYNNTKVAINKINTYIKSWTNNNWEPNKIILTYQAISAMGGRKNRTKSNINNGEEVLQYLTNILKENNYAGLLGWPPVYDDDFFKQKDDADGCMRIINKILKT